MAVYCLEKLTWGININNVGNYKLVLHKSQRIKFAFHKSTTIRTFIYIKINLMNADNINEDMPYMVAKDREYESCYLFCLGIK